MAANVALVTVVAVVVDVAVVASLFLVVEMGWIGLQAVVGVSRVEVQGKGGRVCSCVLSQSWKAKRRRVSTVVARTASLKTYGLEKRCRRRNSSR